MRGEISVKWKVLSVKWIVVMLCFLMVGNTVFAEESATPEEVIAKVRAAAEFLSKAGEAGLAQFNDPKGQWVWKDTYVFVFNCGKEELVAHVSRNLVGVKLLNFLDKNGRYLGFDLCAEAMNPKGGWTEYWWPKAGTNVPERKISYVIKVPGQPYEVSAGIYNPSMTIEKLNGLIK
jgi:cytochrome c